jgi:hypothetical protein
MMFLIGYMLYKCWCLGSIALLPHSIELISTEIHSASNSSFWLLVISLFLDFCTLIAVIIELRLSRNYRNREHELNSQQTGHLQAQAEAAKNAILSTTLVGLLDAYYSDEAIKGRVILNKAAQAGKRPNLGATEKLEAMKAAEVFDMIGSLARLGQVSLNSVSGMMNSQIQVAWEGISAKSIRQQASLLESWKAENGNPRYLDGFHWLYEKIKPIVINVVDRM